MLSGIGDCDALKAVGIDCKLSLPGVGKNLQDHIMVYEAYGILNSTYAVRPDPIELLPVRSKSPPPFLSFLGLTSPPSLS